MGSDVTQAGEVLCGFIVPMTLRGAMLTAFAVGDSGPAEPRMGPFVAPSGGLARLEADDRAPTEALTTVDLDCVRAGTAGSLGAQWHAATPAYTYGWDSPALSTSYEALPSVYTADSADMWVDHAAGTAVWAGACDDGSDYVFEVCYRTEAGVWARKTALNNVAKSAITNDCVALCTDPRGGVMAWIVVGTNTVPVIEVWSAPTYDGTWTLVASHQYDSANNLFGSTPERIEAVLHGGDLLLLYQVAGGVSAYVSRDGGASLVKQTTTLSGGEEVGRAASHSGFCVVPVNDGTYHKVYRVGSLSQDVFAATATNIATMASTHGAALCPMPDGSILAYHGENGKLHVIWSHDAGASWVRTQQVYGDGTADWQSLAAVYVGGGVLLSVRSSITGSYLLHQGAWNTVAHPVASATTIATRQEAWQFGWFPIVTLNAGGYTNGGTGTPTRTRTDDYVEVTCGAGDTATNTRAATGGTTGAGTAIALTLVQVTAGTATITVEVGDGSTDASIDVDVTSTQIRAYPTGGTPSSYANHNATGVIEIEVTCTPATSGTAWSVRYRERDGSDARRWNTVLTSGSSLVGTYTGIRHTLAVAASSTVRWAFAAMRSYVDEAASGMPGARLSPSRSTHLPHGVHVRAHGGPARPGETYTSTYTSRYALTNVDPMQAPSPSTVARTDTAVSTDTVRWYFYPAASGGGYQDIGSDLLGIHVVGIEGAYELSATVFYDGGSFDASAELKTDMFYDTDTGDTVWPSVSGTTRAGQWVEADELAGDLFEYSTGEIRRIRGNTAGYLTSGTTTTEHRATLWIEDPTGTKQTNAGGLIWHRDAVVVVPLEGRRNISSVLIEVDYAAGASGPGPDGYLQVGTINCGPIYVVGMAPDLDDRTVSEHLVSLTEDDVGVVHGRQIAGERRRVELAWVASSHDLTQVHDARTTGDYITPNDSTSSIPIASRYGTPLVMRGILRQCQQGAVPVSWLPRIPRDDASPTRQTFVARRAEGAIYGRLRGPHEMRGVLYVGERGRTQLVRMNAVTIEELR